MWQFKENVHLLKGVVIEKNEQFLILKTDIQEEIICYLPEKYDYSVISPGDNIKVYYSGEIKCFSFSSNDKNIWYI